MASSIKPIEKRRCNEEVYRRVSKSTGFSIQEVKSVADFLALLIFEAIRYKHKGVRIKYLGAFKFSKKRYDFLNKPTDDSSS